MKEVLIPEPFVDVAEGRAFYISVPKLKTNLYTQVTLGFKNAMGIIPMPCGSAIIITALMKS